MSSLRAIVILFALISCTFAIRCYTGTTRNSEKPQTSTNCPASAYCLKTVTRVNNEDLNSYYCAAYQCSNEGCTTTNQVTTCCCSNTDLCNTASGYSALIAVIPIALAKLLF
ncbi:unnamed protein product [Cylicocyclus nassatus]|uniref:Uncharacterized protein n=1 Tax=Cylicocyclus nassatus TaxID=53992 RepID=A0AA36HD81_CYLNA|nr:unnamed protein product [Cylicocyclus nassatus]